MAGTKGKKQKGTIVDRTSRRLSRILVYANLSKKVARWEKDEASEDRKVVLRELNQLLTTAAALHATILTDFVKLRDDKYVPPKKMFSGAIKLTVGKHVYIKPKFKIVYESTYDQSILDELYVSGIVAKKVQLSIGDPTTKSDTIKFVVPKSILQATPPAETSA